jgi:hypothetical protein
MFTTSNARAVLLALLLGCSSIFTACAGDRATPPPAQNQPPQQQTTTNGSATNNTCEQRAGTHEHGPQFELVSKNTQPQPGHSEIQIHGQVDNVVWCSNDAPFSIRGFKNGKAFGQGKTDAQCAAVANPFHKEFPTGFKKLVPSGVPRKEAEGCQFDYIIQFQGEEPRDPHIQFGPAPLTF